MTSSALTPVMTVDARCNFQLPLQVDTHGAACTAAMFFSPDDAITLTLGLACPLFLIPFLIARGKALKIWLRLQCH